MVRPVVVVCNVLISQSGDLLMGLKSSRLMWECPGGKVEDEFLLEAAKREQFEETGMTLTGDPIQLGFIEVQTTSGRYLCSYYLWKTWSGFPQRMEPEKCLAWRWFSLDDLPPEENLTEGTKVFVANVLPHVRAMLANKEMVECE